MDALEQLTTSPWLYAVVLLVVAVDAVIPVVPGEPVVIAAGVFAATGSADRRLRGRGVGGGRRGAASDRVAGVSPSGPGAPGKGCRTHTRDRRPRCVGLAGVAVCRVDLLGTRSIPAGTAAVRFDGVDPRDVLTRPARKPDAVYTYGRHLEQLIDVHLPPRPLDSDKRAPVVVLLHGGFWRQQYDRTHTRPLAEALSADGYVVMTPEYRRTGGDGGYPETFDDVAAAIAAVPEVESVAPGRADLDDVALVGHSAGGQLAMWAALRPDGPDVRTVVALAPVADLVEAYRQGLGGDAVQDLMGGSPDELPDAYAAVDATPSGSVPVTVVHGALDDRVPVDMSRRLEGVHYVELENTEHFGLIDPLSPAWSAVRAALRHAM